MKRFSVLITILLSSLCTTFSQSGRTTGYSESRSVQLAGKPASSAPGAGSQTPADEGDVVRVPTDLITIPVRIATRDGKPVSNVRRNEFKIYENGVEQEIAYFSDDEQPFTVVLALDMSYSSAFKLEDIQLAARIFVSKLRVQDRVMVIAFDEKPSVLCQPTSDRRVLGIAIAGARIGSGTALYDTLEMALREKLSTIAGRRAIILLSDGVDTSSKLSSAAAVEKRLTAEDVIVYPIQYDTFDDVQKSRKKDAEIRFDENDRPYAVPAAPKKGEREADYETARTFFRAISDQTGGRVYPVSSTPNLNDAFANIANELRRIYSIGYYPSEDRKSGATYDIKVRVYRPDLKITARNQYHGK